MVPTLLLAGLFVFGGLFTHTLVEQRHRSRWMVAQGGTLLRTRAPRLIRNTALWSIYMGQMALPGGLLGFMGLFVAGLGLVAIPGMILAVRIWRLGYALLRRDPKAEQEARALERFALVLNLSIFAVTTVLLPVDGAFLGLWLVTSVYGFISIAHARAMGRCAALLENEREHLSQATAAQPSQPAPHAGPSLGHGWSF